jgi:hypothetical protein
MGPSRHPPRGCTSDLNWRFYSFSNGSTVKLIIQRRENLPNQVNEEINRRGWTGSVQALTSGQTAERSYSKDGYGVIRHRLNLE